MMRLRRILLTTVAVAALVGCQPARLPLWSGPPSATGTAVLTPEGTDRYAIASTAEGIRAEALGTDAGSNTRVAFWPKGVARVTDGESCARWSGHTGDLTQQGALLRMTRDGSRVRAVTVTQNILFGARWIFNIHTWDTSRPTPFQIVRGVDLRSSFDDATLSGPLMFCARTIGPTVEFKVWVPDSPEPEWGDATHGGRATLPPGFQTSGQAGWYVGHLRAGEQADFDQLSTWTYDPASRTRRSSAVAGAPQRVVVRGPG